MIMIVARLIQFIVEALEALGYGLFALYNQDLVQDFDEKFS
jgi:hypothetical protein